MNHHDMTNIGVARASNNALKDEVAGLNQYRKALEAKHTALVAAVGVFLEEKNSHSYARPHTYEWDEDDVAELERAHKIAQEEA